MVANIEGKSIQFKEGDYKRRLTSCCKYRTGLMTMRCSETMGAGLGERNLWINTAEANE